MKKIWKWFKELRLPAKVLLITGIAWLGIDIYLDRAEDPTISQWVVDAVYTHPTIGLLVVLAVGWLCGHLFTGQSDSRMLKAAEMLRQAEAALEAWQAQSLETLHKWLVKQPSGWQCPKCSTFIKSPCAGCAEKAKEMLQRATRDDNGKLDSTG